MLLWIQKTAQYEKSNERQQFFECSTSLDHWPGDSPSSSKQALNHIMLNVLLLQRSSPWSHSFTLVCTKVYAGLFFFQSLVCVKQGLYFLDQVVDRCFPLVFAQNQSEHVQLLQFLRNSMICSKPFTFRLYNASYQRNISYSDNNTEIQLQFTLISNSP